MAIASRRDSLDRIFITLSWDAVLTGDHAAALRAGITQYHLQYVEAAPGGISTIDINLYFERILMFVGDAQPMIDIMDRRAGKLVHSETLSFHPSIFMPFLDFARSERFPPYTGESYRKPEFLAVFTHVYNEDDMLTLWERHYAKFVPHRHLYVVDHGSAASPRALLSDATNIVAIPRGALDHANIAGFCQYFQRFLLTQYIWVIHVDSDEFLLDEAGPAAFLDRLAATPPGVILKPKHGCDVVQDYRTEPALSGEKPVSTQRRVLKSAPGYAKPAIASVPTTWGLGFHYALETHAIVEDSALWMAHLAFADIGRNLKRQMKWKHAEKSTVTASIVPETHRGDTRQSLEAIFDQMLAREDIEMPAWMRGMF
jgi:hypothetical protein